MCTSIFYFGIFSSISIVGKVNRTCYLLLWYIVNIILTMFQMLQHIPLCFSYGFAYYLVWSIRSIPCSRIHPSVHKYYVVYWSAIDLRNCSKLQFSTDILCWFLLACFKFLGIISQSTYHYRYQSILMFPHRNVLPLCSTFRSCRLSIIFLSSPISIKILLYKFISVMKQFICTYLF